MLKTLLFAILVLFVRALPAASIMSHEKFVHLPAEEQKQVVVAVMEFVVALEERYKHEVLTSGYSEERFQKYSQVMRQFSNLILPSAHAASRNVRYGQYLSELTTLFGEKNRCLYGGWISDMGGGDLCNHPNYSGVQKFRNLYQSESYCPGRNQITCNPAIFGFKNFNQKSLFCVAAGKENNAADSSSRDCMKKALQDPPEAGTDSPDLRIQKMVEGIALNPADANRMFDFLVQACACGKDENGRISKHYMDYMRPHRTCASILRMMAEVMPKCPAEKGPMDANQLSLLAYIKESTQSTITTETFEQNYSSILSSYVDRADYKAVCGNTPSVTTPAPQTTCTKTVMSDGGCRDACSLPEQERASDGKCYPKCTGTSKIGPDGKCTPGDGVITTGDNPQPGTNPQGGTTGTNPQDGTNTGPQGGGTGTNTPPKTCDAEKELLVGNDCKKLCPEADAEPAAPAVPGTNPPAAAAPPPPPPAPQSQEPRSQTPGPQAPRPQTPAPQTPAPQSQAPVDCVCRDNVQPVDGKCPKKPADAPTSDKFEVTIKSQNVTTVNVQATVTPADKKDDYTIIWFKKGNVTAVITGTGTSSKPEEPRVSVGEDPGTQTTDPAPQTQTPKPEIDRKPGDGQTALPDRDGNWDITAPKMNADYEVCGRFIKKSDNSTVADNKCVKIDKQVAQPGGQRGMGSGMGYPQMGPTRGGASDAVFRGVR